MRGFRTWAGIVALASMALATLMVLAFLRELRPTRRRQAPAPAEGGRSDVDGVGTASTAGEARRQAAPPASEASGTDDTADTDGRPAWLRPAIVAGVAVLAAAAGFGLLGTGSGGEAREPAIEASIVPINGSDTVLVRGENFPPGEDVSVTLPDGGSTTATASASGDFMVQVAPDLTTGSRSLRVLAAVAGTTFSTQAKYDGAVLGVSSVSTRVHPRKQTPTVVVQASPTRAAASPTRPASATATRPATGTATAKPATATATKTVVATATKPATATSTSTPAGGVVTFGNTTTSGLDDDSNWKHINGTQVWVPKKGNLKTLSVYVGQGASGKVRLALYKGSPSGPQQLVAQTGEAAALPGWNKLNTTTTPIIDVGTYWVTAQTDAASTVYRLAPDASATGSIGWTPFAYGPFPASVNGWHSVDDWSFSMSGTINAAGTETTFTATPTPTTGSLSTPLPTMEIPETATVAPIATATPTRTNTPAPPTATSTTAPTPTPGGGAGCVTNCGTPRFFCDTGGWAFCDDYRDLYCPSLNFLNDCRFPDIDGVGRHVSVAAYSSTDPDYIAEVDSIPRPHGWFFNQQEHFHSEIEDGNFGIAIARHHQPFDFAGREGHIHFEADLKTSHRRYVRLILSPEVTKSMVDDRQGIARPNNALDMWFQNGTFQGHLYKNGAPACAGGCSNAFSVESPRYYGADNVRDLIDVYVSRTHVRILVNGTEYVNANVPDLGFDRAYVYLAQASYNPCKDGQCTENLQIFHWDNFAFDGPVLGDNSLVPAGMQDVVFMAYGQASCRVKGVNAVPNGAPTGYVWISWVARMPVQSVSTADVSCTDGDGGHRWNDSGRTPFDFEVIRR